MVVGGGGGGGIHDYLQRNRCREVHEYLVQLFWQQYRFIISCVLFFVWKGGDFYLQNKSQ